MGHDGFKKLTADNLLKGDPASRMLVKVTGAVTEEISDREWLDIVMKAQLDDFVPEDVHALFEAARGAFVYGYYFYPLYTLAQEHVLRAAEAAITLKCEELKAPSSAKTFAARLNWLKERGELSAQEWEDWDLLRGMRNEASHPRFQTIMPQNMAFFMLKSVAEDINRLFRNRAPPTPLTG